MNAIRETDIVTVTSSKIKDGYQCGWCRRILQQPAGLLRHRTYCSWNPALRQTTEKRVKATKPAMNIKDIQQMDPTRISLQCEWCNRFFSNERGVIRHKAYCAWHPTRLKTLKEERRRRRIEKAVFKKTREDARLARHFETHKKIDLMRAKAEIENDGLIKSEPMDSSIPSSPTSSDDFQHPSSPNSSRSYPISPFSYKSDYSAPYTFGPASPTERATNRIDAEVLKRTSIFSCQTSVRLAKSTSPKLFQPVRISVITSCNPHCLCGCKKVEFIQPTRILQRKSSIAHSPQSVEDDEDDEEIIVDI